jgi:hypothetical protein
MTWYGALRGIEKGSLISTSIVVPRLISFDATDLFSKKKKAVPSRDNGSSPETVSVARDGALGISFGIK